ncbi:MAG TPA: Crp/Fnr family transcriptional regulator [Thermomicrobiales bacterium]|nr:Crp/Fnr family transcriptional regulator [Thermomicrobiales bacterium]
MPVQPIDLSRAPLFAALPPDHLAAVARAASLRRYRRGAILYRRGEPCRRLAVVLDGLVSLGRPGGSGGTVTRALVPAGGLLGVEALRGVDVHDSDAVALARVSAAELPIAVALDLGCRHPPFLAGLARGLVERMEWARADLARATQPDTAARLLCLLRALARASGQATGVAEGSCPLGVRLSHADLGRLVGADRATVTRALRALSAARQVWLERGHVVAVAPGDARRAGRAA